MSESRATRMANNIMAPVSGRIFRKDTSTTTAYMDLSSYANRYVTVTAFTENCLILCGTGTSFAITGTATSGIEQCAEIPAGQSMTFIVDPSNPSMGYETASGTGYIRVAITSPAESSS